MAGDKLYLTPTHMHELVRERTQLRRRLGRAIVTLRSNRDETMSESLNAILQIETRLAKVTDLLSYPAVGHRRTTEQVKAGSTVYLQSGSNVRGYTLGDRHEPLANSLPPESPLGHLLLGHRVGERLTMDVMGKAVSFKILRVE